MPRLNDDKRESCNTVYGGCKAAPVFLDSHTRAKCFKCGEAVCVNCSRRRKYSRYGIQRLCGICIEELGMTFTFLAAAGSR